MEARELDESELRQRIKAGLEAADELKERLARLDEEQPRERPKLRLIKGGAVAVALFAGVEWLRGYRRASVGVLMTTAAAGGIAYLTPAITDPPHAEMEPPATRSLPPPKPRPPLVSVAPRPTPRLVSPTQARAPQPKASPPRTSPLRTQPAAPTAGVPSTQPPAKAAVPGPSDPVASITQTLIPTPDKPSAALESPCPLLGLNPIRVCLDLSGTSDD